MKILFLTNIPAPYRIDFFSELGKLCELTVVFERIDATNRDKDWLSSTPSNFKPIFLKGLRIGAESSLCPSIIKYLKKGAYDAIIVGGYGTPTGMIAIQHLRNKGIPFILNADGGFIKYENRLKYSIKSYLIKSASYWLSTGNTTTDYLVHYGASLNEIFCYPFTSLLKKDLSEKILTISEKKSYKEKLSIKEDKMVISIGRFIPIKGFDILIRSAIKIQDNIGIYIIGGEPIPEYINLIKKLNITNIHFIDFISKLELFDYYSASDLFVLPTRGDVWGLVVNEAMAHGLPIITTNMCIAGIELISEGENGFIIPVDDSEQLARAIDRVLSNDSLVRTMSEKSLEKIKNFNIENMAKEIYGFLVSKQISERPVTTLRPWEKNP